MHVSQKHFYCSHISSHLYLEVKYFKIQCVCVCVCVCVYICLCAWIHSLCSACVCTGVYTHVCQRCCCFSAFSPPLSAPCTESRPGGAGAGERAAPS